LLYWVLRPWRQTFDFKGRATRREYWFFLVQLYAAAVIAIFGFALLLVLAAPDMELENRDGSVGVSIGIAFLLALIPYFSASIRRLHDHDKSGWLLLLTFIPLVGWIFYLIMMLTPGTPGENGYGPDPRERLESARDVSRIFS
jgi:uncharacterized membrane protein YhaH (DUF805 family)